MTKCTAKSRDALRGELNCELMMGHKGHHQDNKIIWPQQEQKDEAWIRDLNAADMIVEINGHEAAARACEGLKTHCAYCGAEFPMWPPQGVMDHCQVEHARDLTIQQLTSCANLCSPDWTVSHVQYLMAFVLTYVPLRRRLRDLDLIKFAEPEKGPSGLLDANGRRVQ